MIKRIGLLLVLFPAICMADSVVPIDSVETSVNIRLSPDASSEIVGKLEQGSSAEIVSSIEGWHEIRLVGDASGYISADWTRVVTDEELAARAEAAPVATEVPAEDVAGSVEETVAETSVAETVVQAVPVFGGVCEWRCSHDLILPGNQLVR